MIDLTLYYVAISRVSSRNCISPAGGALSAQEYLPHTNSITSMPQTKHEELLNNRDLDR